MILLSYRQTNCFHRLFLFCTVCNTKDKSEQDDLSCELISFEDLVVLLLEYSGVEMISVISFLSISFTVKTPQLSENFFVGDVSCVKTESSIKKYHNNVNK